MLEYQKSSARPWPLPSLIDQINVDLTPIKLIFGAEANL